MASRLGLRQNDGMDFSNANDLWASILWGGIGGGYLVYGWRQKSSIPFAGGVVMSMACFLPALWMSLASVATIVAVWWLLRRGD